MRFVNENIIYGRNMVYTVKVLVCVELIERKVIQELILSMYL